MSSSKRERPPSYTTTAGTDSDASFDGKIDPTPRKKVDETDDEKVRKEAAALARKAMWICFPATLVFGELCSIWPAITYADVDPVWFLRVFIITSVGWGILLIIEIVLLRMLYKADQANRLWFVRRYAWIFGGWLFGYTCGSLATVIGLKLTDKLEGDDSYGLAYSLLWVQLVLGVGPCIAAFVVYVIYLRRIKTHEKRIQAQEIKHSKVGKAIRSSSKKVKRKLSSSSRKNKDYGAVAPSDSDSGGDGGDWSDEKKKPSSTTSMNKKNPTQYTSAAEDSLLSTDEDGQHPNGANPEEYKEFDPGSEKSYGRGGGAGYRTSSKSAVKGGDGQQGYSDGGYSTSGNEASDDGRYSNDYSRRAKQPAPSAAAGYSYANTKTASTPSRPLSDYPPSYSSDQRPSYSSSTASATARYPSSPGANRSSGLYTSSSPYDNRRASSYSGSSISRQASTASTYRQPAYPPRPPSASATSSNIPVEVVNVDPNGQPTSVTSRQYVPGQGYIPAIPAGNGSYPSRSRSGPTLTRPPYPASSSPYPASSATSPRPQPLYSAYPSASNPYSSSYPPPSSSPPYTYQAYSPPPSSPQRYSPPPSQQRYSPPPAASPYGHRAASPSSSSPPPPADLSRSSTRASGMARNPGVATRTPSYAA